jgi:hypothetical protein
MLDQMVLRSSLESAHEIERNVIGQLDHHEMVKWYCGRAAENSDQKRRGLLIVATPDNRMIQLNWHDVTPLIAFRVPNRDSEVATAGRQSASLV